MGQGRSKNRRFVALCDTCQGRVGQLQGSDSCPVMLERNSCQPLNSRNRPSALHSTSSDKPILKLQFKLDMFSGRSAAFDEWSSVSVVRPGEALVRHGRTHSHHPIFVAPSDPAPQNCTPKPLFIGTALGRQLDTATLQFPSLHNSCHRLVDLASGP